MADDLAAITAFRWLRPQPPADRALEVFTLDYLSSALYLQLEVLLHPIQSIQFSVDEMGVLADINPDDLIAPCAVRLRVLHFKIVFKFN